MPKLDTSVMFKSRYQSFAALVAKWDAGPRLLCRGGVSNSSRFHSSFAIGHLFEPEDLLLMMKSLDAEDRCHKCPSIS